MRTFFINHIVLIILIGISSNILAQPQQEKHNNNNSSNSAPFEGIITFKKETFNDTTFFTYYIKNDFVKLIINENCEDCESTDAMLFDIKKQTIFAIKPAVRMYKEVDVKPYVRNPEENFNIKQNPTNTKIIKGIECEQWRIKNKKEKTEITYWVAKGNYYFFQDFLKLWNRAEKHSQYYLQVSNSNGYFPFLSVERSTLREKRMRLEIINYENKPLEQSIFEIPPEFKNYDN